MSIYSVQEAACETFIATLKIGLKLIMGEEARTRQSDGSMSRFGRVQRGQVELKHNVRTSTSHWSVSIAKCT